MVSSNDHSLWAENLRGQALDVFVEQKTDPLLHRTFGVYVRGKKLIKKDKLTLTSAKPERQHYLTARTHTGFYQELEEWLKQVAEIQNQPPETARSAHQKWWNDFNQRSYISISTASIENKTPPVVIIKKPKGQFNIGISQKNEYGFLGSIAFLKIYQQPLTPTQIDQRKIDPHAEFDFSISGEKEGVYPDQQDSSRTARNRGPNPQGNKGW